MHAGVAFTKKSRYSRPDRKLMHVPPEFEKAITLAFFKGHLSTNPILCALHFQGPKFNMCVCVCFPLSEDAID